ncbi:MAG: aminotransferase class I/II-fold pyridoxal phosphate-dependent enzyme [Myxococcota bacterium]
MSLTTRAARRLAALRAEHLLRVPPQLHSRRGVEYTLGERRVVGFCSNDYLGLATEKSGASPQPTGAGASRLIAGDLPHHRDVEAKLAALCGAQDAVVFPSGFQLNVGVIPCLVERGDVVHSDRLNHASIIDGLRLARATPNILPHGRAPDDDPDPSRLHWWMTESIFSMDGDRLDARALGAYQARGGTLYVDEAHAFGLFPGGVGLLHDHDLVPDVLVGTLSKAYGCAGAFVAASSDVCHWIRNRARSFVFSTGTAPSVLADIAARIELLAGEEGQRLRATLWRNARHLAAALRGNDPGASDPPSPIFPIVVGDNAAAMRVAADLLAHGIHVQAIRPPTVPVGTARLRLTVTAAHTPEQIEELAERVKLALADEGLPLKIERGAAAPSAESPARESSW